MSEKRTYWLDESRNITRIFWWLWVVCGVLFIADAFYAKHPHFEAEGWFGFYGVFGFVACVGLVLAAKTLRKILKRPEDYYD